MKDKDILKSSSVKSASDHTIDAMRLYKQEMESAIEDSRHLLRKSLSERLTTDAEYYVPASSSGYTSYTTTSRTPDPLEHEILNRIRDIHYEVCTTLPRLQAEERLIKALESNICPTDDCRKCKYYIAGTVDGCDKSRAMAEYLLDHNIVRVTKTE